MGSPERVGTILHRLGWWDGVVMDDLAAVTLACLVCLYVRPVPEADAGELELLTVVNGQMVCLRHVPCAKSTYHDTLKAGVVLESQGAIQGLSAYQEWRAGLDTSVV